MKKKIYICRVSDLLTKGFDRDFLVNEFVRINEEVWGKATTPEYLWTEEKVSLQFEACPEMHYVAFIGNKIVGTLTNMRTNQRDMLRKKTWLEKTENGTLNTHDSEGQLAFGVDLSVTEEGRGKVSDRMVFTALLVTLMGEGLKSVYLGARIPEYHLHKNISVEEYVFKTDDSGEPLDKQLRFYSREGFEIVEIIPNNMEDPESLNFGVLIKWDNPLYKAMKYIPFLRQMVQAIAKTLFIRVPPMKSG